MFMPRSKTNSGKRTVKRTSKKTLGSDASASTRKESSIVDTFKDESKFQLIEKTSSPSTQLPMLKPKSFTQLLSKKRFSLTNTIHAEEDMYNEMAASINRYDLSNDVTICIGDVYTGCHMAVLQGYSSYFRDIDKQDLIRLPDDLLNPDIFTFIYQWMLNDDLKIERNEIVQVFKSAVALGVQTLVDQCMSYFNDDLRFYGFTAERLYWEIRHDKLKEFTAMKWNLLERIGKYYLTLVGTDNFRDYNFTEVCFLFSSKTLSVNSEVEVFMSACRWLNLNWDKHKNHMNELFSNIQFGLFPEHFLTELSKKKINCNEVDCIIDNPKIQEMIEKGQRYVQGLATYKKKSEVEALKNYMAKFELKTPFQRDWIFDPNCSYHTDSDKCQYDVFYPTYDEFMDYIKELQFSDKWRLLGKRAFGAVTQLEEEEE